MDLTKLKVNFHKNFTPYHLLAYFACAVVGYLGIGYYYKIHAQPKYAPSEVQTLKLQVAQDKVVFQGTAYAKAQNDYQAALTAYTDLATGIRKENKWPDNVKFDITHMTFCDNIDSQGMCPQGSAMPPTPASQPASAPTKKP